MRIAVLSPAFAVPAVFPGIHEQAMRRMRELGWEPVEYPTTRQPHASPADRAADIHAAFADPSVDAVFATIGGNDQITVIPHLDADLIAAHPKQFFGYSDNTNLHNFLHELGIPSVYGGSTQVHLGSGSGIDDAHLRTLRAALAGDSIELTAPSWGASVGISWEDPRSLTEDGPRHAPIPWQWSGPAERVSGRTWGGCIEVLNQIAIAGRLPEHIDGAVLLLEASEELTPAGRINDIVRAFGERGFLRQAAGILVAAPPTTNVEGRTLDPDTWRDTVLGTINHYAPHAVCCFGVPFGHTLPQLVVPYGGRVTLDGRQQRIRAHYEVAGQH
ncbi:LD-carboxypeptidase [Corynebacterium sp. CCM 8835]|uniref:LD-carboxypeptidase n=1 Tax=Corynebacterium antarcticum TaxID=2800405 RepID=A0ABS1FI87_9CORY|nr:S66 peptidase family protein [Corynebacterium antarcticum]MCK7661082.1 LD-carboxypeptidase [Corynebacterium antarcticum]MCL0245830.1 LD-carboxypeptidase [Corynebacterium antarcticum]MCX7491713.1 LD-carboxypeptidase [Corynebacterium antarcticum]MCX7540403.1 LD-carboxypeptidase [Corynebacterium antarcticum]